MGWNASTAAVNAPGIVAGVAWLLVIASLVVLLRAAGVAERLRVRHRRHHADEDADRPPEPAPRTAYELVACALVTLDVEHATLFSGVRADRLSVLSRGHLDARADAEAPEVHAEVAAAAVRGGGAVEVGGLFPAPVVAAAPVVRDGRLLGALAVSARRTTRGRLTFAERRSLAQLAELAADLPALRRRPRISRVGPRGRGARSRGS